MSKNNFWDELDNSQTQSSDFWSDLDNSAGQDQQSTYSTGQKIASGAKSAVAGVLGSIPDTAALAYNLPAMGINAASRNGLPLWKASERQEPDPNAPQLPLIPSATEAIDSGIDSLSGGYTETPKDQRVFNESVKLGSSVAGGGGVAKLAQKGGSKAIESIGKFAGSLNPWHVAGGAAAGGAIANAEENGDSTLSVLGQGLAASTAVSNLPKITKGVALGATKGAITALGVGKKNLNLDAAKAAQELEIVLPKAVASDGKLIAYADRFVSHAPFAGNIMKERYAKIGNKILKELDNAYDSVLPKKLLAGIDDTISTMYKTAEDLLPEQASTYPKSTVQTIADVQESIKAPFQSGDFQKIQTVISKLQKEFAPSNIKGIPTDVKTLINQKENLNNTIGELQTAKGQMYLSKINNAIREDISTYGKTNPEWFEYFSGADKLFAKKAKREDLVKMLAPKAESSTHGEITVGNLSKILNTPDTRDKLKNLVEPEIFDRLEKLGKVTQAFAKKNKNIINASGTTVAQNTINWVSSLVGLGSGNPVEAGLGIIVATGLAHLLTDKRSLDLAIKLAEKPTEKAAVSFNARMKEVTGYTPVTIGRAATKKEAKESDKPKQTSPFKTNPWK